MSIDGDLSYYGLHAKPFQPTTDPRFLWLGKAHRQALATLKAGVQRDGSLLLLTGDVGTGKTVLINALADSLRDGIVVAKVLYPLLDPPDFLKAIADACNLDSVFGGRDVFLREWSGFVDTAHAGGKRVLLIIDEAQSLGPELFEQIRHLAEMGRGRNSFSMLLVGQKELDAILSEPENAPLRQGLAARCNIGPLTESEVGEYIAHRLTVAGAERNVFSADAIHEIWSLSGGIPRVINVVSDLALLSGCSRRAGTIGREIVNECANRLRTGDGSRERVKGRQRRGSVRARRAVREARTRRAGRAAMFARMALIAMLAVIAGYVIAGYVHYPGRYGEARPDSTPGASQDLSRKEGDLAELGQSGGPGAGKALEPVGVSTPEAEPTRRSAVESTVESPAELPARNPVKAPQRPKRVGSGERRNPSGEGGGPSPADEEVGLAESARPALRSRAFISEEEAGAPDPSRIVGWLLKEYSPSQD